MRNLSINDEYGKHALQDSGEAHPDILSCSSSASPLCWQTTPIGEGRRHRTVKADDTER